MATNPNPSISGKVDGHAHANIGPAKIIVDIDEVCRAAHTLAFLEAGDVVELRLVGSKKGVISGYFDNIEKLVEAAAKLSGRLDAPCYFTLNPMRRDLLSRCANRVKHFSRYTTADADILQRRWLPIDIDPVRPSGISSTSEEHDAAISRARTISAELETNGWPAGTVIDSGNGAQILYRVNLPNDEASANLIERVLKGFAKLYGDTSLEIDIKVFNPSRIWKLPGTLAMKGDSTAERPHRLARVLSYGPPQIITMQQLSSVAVPPELSTAKTSGGNLRVTFDLDEFLRAYGDDYKKSAWKGGEKYVFKTCPNNPEHRNSFCITRQAGNGGISAKCLHQSCAGFDWAAYRALREPRRGLKAVARPVVVAENMDAEPPGPEPTVWTEDDLAIRLAKTYPDMRYVDDWKRWMRYTPEGVWRKDNTRSIFDRAKGICRDASVGINSKDVATLKWLRSAKTRAAVENMAREMPDYAAVPEQWDADLMAVNTPDGTCHLQDGTIHEHRLEDYLTKSTAVAPHAGPHPLWDKFLDRITAGDAEMQRYLQRVAGYCLSGDISEHVLFFLYGTGANGKGTFTNTLLGIFVDYAQTAAMEVFTDNTNDRHPTDIAALRGAHLVVASETEAGKRWAESRIKMLTGGDPVRARFMHCDEFEFTPAFKLMIQGNHKPGLRSVDVAMRRRLHLVPFTVTIPAEERDTKLPEKLRQEWPAILQWAVDGCLAWQREGLNPPAVVRDATEEYFQSEDAILRWMEERCIVSPQAGSAKASELYQNYKAWAEQTGEFCMNQKRFGQELLDHGFKSYPSNGVRYEGIRLAASE